MIALAATISVGLTTTHTVTQPRLAARSAVVCSAEHTTRRTFAATLAAAVAAQPLASFASIKAGDAGDGTWAEHQGAFTDDFFKDFKSTSTGFKYKFVEMGEGDKPKELQNVYMHYTGYLLDGTKFDSSYGEGDKAGKGVFKFRLGEGKVIPGWESVIYGMKPGQKVIVTIPPQYAYGDKKQGGGFGGGVEIPPDSTLVFYMELLRLGKVKGEKTTYGTIQGRPGGVKVDAGTVVND